MSAEEILEGAMKLPADARWRLGMRLLGAEPVAEVARGLLESLEVVADSGDAAGSEPDAEPSE